MSTRLSDRTAIITGAQQGIGFACARAMLNEGACVVANWLDEPHALAGLADEFDSGALVPVHADLTDADAIRAMFESADKLGGADILVNNAAIFPRVPFLEMTDEDWDGVLNLNLKATFRCAREFAQRCHSQQRPGTIINLTSGAAFRGSPRGVHYVTSKAGVVGLTRAMSQELAEHRIRVNAVAPGLTDTAQPRDGMTEQEIIDAAGTHPLGRIAQPEDIASTIMFLASDEAAHITGQTLHVNGGQFLG